jgi:hypothetical protein
VGFLKITGIERLRLLPDFWIELCCFVRVGGNGHVAYWTKGQYTGSPVLIERSWIAITDSPIAVQLDQAEGATISG